MSWLVTGATGLVGNNVVRQLLERGESVRVLVREKSDPRPLAGLEVERIAGDITDEASVRRAMEGVERVVHSAAMVVIGSTGMERFSQANVEGVRNVAAAAREAGARMVHVSSADAVPRGTRREPGNEETSAEMRAQLNIPYTLTKRAAERVIAEEVALGLQAVIVNPTYILGPWDWKPSSGRMLLEVGRRWTPIAPPGGRDFVDARDVAAGALLALERGRVGRRYLLGGEAMSFLEAWRTFGRVAGVGGPIVRLGPHVIRGAGRVASLWGWIRGGPEPLFNTGAAEGAVLEQHFVFDRAQQELGFTARPFEATVRETWDWFCEHGYVRPRRPR